MTIFTLKTSEDEARDILDGKKNHVFRDANYKFGVGDVIQFTVYKEGEPVRNDIDLKTYKITHVSTECPIEEGFKSISFREVK